MIILTNNDYKLGDIIEVDHEQDYFGRIEELTIRYTVLRTVDLRRVIVPNIVLITYPVRTYEIEHTVRYEVSFTVHYASDIVLVEDTTIAAVNTVAIVNQPDLSMCLLHAMGDRGLEFVVYAYIDPKCGLTKKKIRARLTKAIYTALHDAGIVIVYPHRSLTIDHEDAMLYETVASLYS